MNPKTLSALDLSAFNLPKSVFILLIFVSTAASQGYYGQQYAYGDCQRSFIVGVDLQKISSQVSPEGFAVDMDGRYIGSTNGDGQLGANAYSGQHKINASKSAGAYTFSGSWSGTIGCYYPTGGTNYVPILIKQIPTKVAALDQSSNAQPMINIPKPTNLEDIVFIVLIAVALIIGIVVVLKSMRFFLVNAILGLLVLFLANAFIGLNIMYTWLVILVCAIGGIAGAIIVIILHLNGISI